MALRPRLSPGVPLSWCQVCAGCYDVVLFRDRQGAPRRRLLAGPAAPSIKGQGSRGGTSMEQPWSGET